MADRIEEFGKERATIREAAIREAAEVAENMSGQWWFEYRYPASPHCADPQHQGMILGADHVLIAIRALIGENK